MASHNNASKKGIRLRCNFPATKLSCDGKVHEERWVVGYAAMGTGTGSKTSRMTLSGEFKLSGKAAKALEVGTAERRTKARISQPFPTKVDGTDAAGKNFEIDCVVENISSSGVYLCLPRQVEPGSQLDLVIKFENGQGTGAKAFLRCHVLRNEPQADGLYGIAMAISYYRFL